MKAARLPLGPRSNSKIIISQETKLISMEMLFM